MINFFSMLLTKRQNQLDFFHCKWLMLKMPLMPWLNHKHGREKQITQVSNFPVYLSSGVVDRCFQCVKMLPKMKVNINKGCYITGGGGVQWKRISRKQGTRWQHLSRLKLVSSSLCKKRFFIC